MALKKQPFELIYIDAFAGAGRSKVRTAWEGADEEDLQLLDYICPECGTPGQMLCQ